MINRILRLRADLDGLLVRDIMQDKTVSAVR
jgi:hypothetical protein